MNKNRGSGKFASGLFWSYAERFLAQGITLLVSIVLARILDPEHYGIIAIVSIFITICDALVTGGFGNALVQKKDATDIDFDSISWLSISIAGILYIVLFFSAPIIASFYEESLLVPVLRVMGVKFIFSAFNSVQQAYVQRKMIFKKFFWATLGSSVISGVVGIGMALNGFGVWALVGQYLSNTLISTIILCFTIGWRPRFRVSISSIKKLWKFGAGMLAATMTYVFKDNIRSLIIGKRFTSSDLAFYNQGKKYPQLLVTDIVESLGKVMFPVLSAEQESADKIKYIMRKSVRVSSYVLTPCIIGLLSVADTFVLAVLTDKWLPCVPYMRVLSLVYITRPMTTIFQKGLLAVGKTGVNLFHEIITSVLTIILLLVAVFAFDSIILIAWSYVLIMILGLLVFAFFVKKYFAYSFWEMLTDYLPSFILSCAMGAAAFACGALPFAPAIRLIVQIAAGAIVYIVLSCIFKVDGFVYLKKTVSNRKK